MNQRKIALVFWIASKYGKPMNYTRAKFISYQFTYKELERLYIVT